MKNLVRVRFRYNDALVNCSLDELVKRWTAIVEDYLNMKTDVKLISPTETQLKDGYDHYMLCIIVHAEVGGRYLFDKLNTYNNIDAIDVVPTKFLDNNKNIQWTNEGYTVYSDGSIYTDPYYKLWFNGAQTYEIIDIPLYCRKFNPRERNYYESQNCKYMWRCTACWDNWLKADNIDDAIKEFETILEEKLWKSVTSVKDKLIKATEEFRLFNNYIRGKE